MSRAKPPRFQRRRRQRRRWRQKRRCVNRRPRLRLRQCRPGKHRSLTKVGTTPVMNDREKNIIVVTGMGLGPRIKPSLLFDRTATL